MSFKFYDKHIRTFIIHLLSGVSITSKACGKYIGPNKSRIVLAIYFDTIRRYNETETLKTI